MSTESTSINVLMEYIKSKFQNTNECEFFKKTTKF